MRLVSRFLGLFLGHRLLKAAAATVTVISLSVPGFGLTAAQAAPGKNPPRKISADLQAALDAVQTPKARWARGVQGRRMVQVVFVSAEADVGMAARSMPASLACAC